MKNALKLTALCTVLALGATCTADQQANLEFADVIQHNEYGDVLFPCSIYREDADGTMHMFVKIDQAKVCTDDLDESFMESNDVVFLRGRYCLVTQVKLATSDWVDVQLLPVEKSECNKLMFSAECGPRYAYRIFAKEKKGKIVYAYVKIPASDPYVIEYKALMNLDGTDYVVKGIRKCDEDDNVPGCISVKLERFDENAE